LSVSIKYRAPGAGWVTVSPSWESGAGGYWYYDWLIPKGAVLGLYDVMVDVSDGAGGSASVTEYGEFTVVNVAPAVTFVGAWGSTGRLDPAGSVSRGANVRIYTYVTDAETASSQLAVSIKYRAPGAGWVTVSPQWESGGGYWYYDWLVPTSATLGLYDVSVEVSDGSGGSASVTELGEFTVVNVVPVVSLVAAWGPTGRLDPAGSVSRTENVRIFTYVSDVETASNLLSVSIKYRAPGAGWVTVSPSWESGAGGYWYYDWLIPKGAVLGLYDVMVDVSDGAGGSASVTEYGEFTVVF
jgi:hypothetical protein